MRDIKRIKRRKRSVGVAIFSAAILGVATEKCVAAENEKGESASLLASTERLAPSDRSEKGNDGFWPRLGSIAVPTSDLNGNASWTVASPAAAASARSRVESANFIGYSGSFGENEREGAANGRTRLVDWTTSDALSVRTVDESSTAPVGKVGEIGETAKINADKENATTTAVASIGEVGGTAEVDSNKEEAGAAAIASIGESESRSKTPILRDEPTAPTRGGGSFGSALVSTFGALAVVLGAFLALVAFLKRTAPNGGCSGGALEIVDSLAVGDKTRLWTIRWGNRLILAAKTPEKIAPLAEIDDVDEANALLAEIERRKSATATGEVGAKAAAIWKRGVGATSVWRTAFGAKGRR